MLGLLMLHKDFGYSIRFLRLRLTAEHLADTDLFHPQTLARSTNTKEG